MRASLAAHRKDLLAVLLLLVLVLLVSLPSLHSTNIDDLDSAHHLMDAYFFGDFFRDHPHSLSYVFRYYQQYPALGFIFWPPLFPFIAGLFVLVGGPHVLTVRFCMLFFGALFTVGFYALLRRQTAPFLALCATAACITVPGMFWSFNEIMLELPTLAVMTVALLAYLHLRDQAEAPTSIPRALLTALALAAVVYTKQPAYFLYLAIAADALRVPALLRKRETWLTIAAFVVFLLPLAVFTLKFGHANLAQSVGSNTQLIMKDYHATPRWSLAAWTYYPRLAPSLLNPAVLVLGLVGLGLSLVSAELRNRSFLWLGWFFAFYLTFSFYDNRLPRHSTFWWPAWIALAALAVDQLARRISRPLAQALPVLLLLAIPVQLLHGEHEDFADYHDQMPIVRRLFENGSPGNVLLLGPDKQTWIAFTREFDRHRDVHALRGEPLLATGLSLGEICRQYQVGTILLEIPTETEPASSSDASPAAALANALASTPFIQRLPDSTYRRRGHLVRVLAFRYTGPRNSTLPDVPLSNKLL